MKTYKTEAVFELDDFTDPEGLELRLGISWKLFDDELLCDVSCLPVPYTPATRYDPPEGGYLEDLSVVFGIHDITHELTERALDLLSEQIMEELGDAEDRY